MQLNTMSYARVKVALRSSMRTVLRSAARCYNHSSCSKKSGSNSVVECQLPKLNVAGSIPVSRSKILSASSPNFYPQCCSTWLMSLVWLCASFGYAVILLDKLFPLNTPSRTAACNLLFSCEYVGEGEGSTPLLFRFRTLLCLPLSPAEQIPRLRKKIAMKSQALAWRSLGKACCWE